jgi:hypothetical protein
MAKRGRKSVYETHIEPRFSDISKWLESGATEKQIYENLGVSRNAFYKYKKDKKEFYELLKNGRKNLVVQLRGALVKKALGFKYVERKTVTGKDANGETVERTEIYERAALPDVAALNLCLKNYDPDEWANDPQMLRIKEKELELKREIADRDAW